MMQNNYKYGAATTPISWMPRPRFRWPYQPLRGLHDESVARADLRWAVGQNRGRNSCANVFSLPRSPSPLSLPAAAGGPHLGGIGATGCLRHRDQQAAPFRSTIVVTGTLVSNSRVDVEAEVIGGLRGLTRRRAPASPRRSRGLGDDENYRLAVRQAETVVRVAETAVERAGLWNRTATRNWSAPRTC
jgi:hypothetical protein